MRDTVTVLMAEDDDGQALLIQRNLRRGGLVTFHFSTGQEIIDYLFDAEGTARCERCGPLVVLLDIHMPGISGIQVLERIKADPELNVMPVIMLTTTGDRATIRTCYERGCNGYIIKSADGDEFAKALQGLGVFLQTIAVPDVHVNAGPRHCNVGMAI
jgi:CheY-like chemotaxis protein